MKVLLKVAKILPKLGSTNPHEKMLVLETIERLLSGDGISWTDAGMKLTEFLTQIAGIEDEPALTAPPRPAPGFSRAAAPQPQPATATRWTSAAQPQPAPQARPAAPQPPPPRYSPPPPRTPQVDLRARGTVRDKESLIAELMRRQLYVSIDEKTALEAIEFLLQSGMPISSKQQKFLETISKRI
jgi:hypothetical protein